MGLSRQHLFGWGAGESGPAPDQPAPDRPTPPDRPDRSVPDRPAPKPVSQPESDGGGGIWGSIKDTVSDVAQVPDVPWSKVPEAVGRVAEAVTPAPVRAGADLLQRGASHVIDTHEGFDSLRTRIEEVKPATDVVGGALHDVGEATVESQKTQKERSRSRGDEFSISQPETWMNQRAPVEALQRSMGRSAGESLMVGGNLAEWSPAIAQGGLTAAEFTAHHPVDAAQIAKTAVSEGSQWAYHNPGTIGNFAKDVAIDTAKDPFTYLSFGIGTGTSTIRSLATNTVQEVAERGAKEVVERGAREALEGAAESVARETAESAAKRTAKETVGTATNRFARNFRETLTGPSTMSRTEREVLAATTFRGGRNIATGRAPTARGAIGQARHALGERVAGEGGNVLREHAANILSGGHAAPSWGGPWSQDVYRASQGTKFVGGTPATRATIHALAYPQEWLSEKATEAQQYAAEHPDETQSMFDKLLTNKTVQEQLNSDLPAWAPGALAAGAPLVGLGSGALAAGSALSGENPLQKVQEAQEAVQESTAAKEPAAAEPQQQQQQQQQENREERQGYQPMYKQPAQASGGTPFTMPRMEAFGAGTTAVAGKAVRPAAVSGDYGYREPSVQNPLGSGTIQGSQGPKKSALYAGINQPGPDKKEGDGKRKRSESFVSGSVYGERADVTMSGTRGWNAQLQGSYVFPDLNQPNTKPDAKKPREVLGV